MCNATFILPLLMVVVVLVDDRHYTSDACFPSAAITPVVAPAVRAIGIGGRVAAAGGALAANTARVATIIRNGAVNVLTKVQGVSATKQLIATGAVAGAAGAGVGAGLAGYAAYGEHTDVTTEDPALGKERLRILNEAVRVEEDRLREEAATKEMERLADAAHLLEKQKLAEEGRRQVHFPTEEAPLRHRLNLNFPVEEEVAPHRRRLHFPVDEENAELVALGNALQDDAATLKMKLAAVERKQAVLAKSRDEDPPAPLVRTHEQNEVTLNATLAEQVARIFAQMERDRNTTTAAPWMPPSYDGYGDF